MCISKAFKVIAGVLFFCIWFDEVKAQWSGSAAVNTPVAVAASHQGNARIVSDGSGGHFVAWIDSRSGTQNIYLQRLNSAGLAQWTANGIKVVSVDRSQEALVGVSDGAGGVILAWSEDRGDGTGKNVYAQRFTGAGTALWATDGVVLTGTGKQQNPVICSDGNNGAFVGFDQPDFSLTSHVFGQWVDANGMVKWGVGVPVSTTGAEEAGGAVIADGTGGAIYTWHDGRTFASGYNIYAQRISALGNKEWTNDGVLVTGTNGEDIWPSIINDGSTGAFIVWEKNIGSGNYYGQHINNNGASLWVAHGIQLLTGANNTILTGDGGTGFHLTWRDTEVRAQHYTSTGSIQWAAGGVPFTTGLTGQFSALSSAPDGAGGLYTTWTTYVHPNFTMYAQYVNQTGTIQFATGGIVLSNAPGSKAYPVISTRSGLTGAVFTWQDMRSGNNDIYAQLLLPTGFPPEPPPTIQSFTPASGAAGTSVTLTGYGFNTTASNNIVYFDGMKATVTAATSSSLTVTVPPHTTYAQISVLNTVTRMQGRSRGFFSGSHAPVTTDLSKFDFLQAQTYSVSGGQATKVTTADIDGDGKTDVIALNSTSAWVDVFRNASTAGTFGLSGTSSINTGGKAEHISIGDLDNDGQPDLVVSDWQNNKIYIWRNESTAGNFSFGNRITLASPYASATVLSDIDGDGKADIVAASIAGNTLSIFQNSSTPGNMTAASFSAPVTKQVSGASIASLIASGDLDGDGKDDFLVGDGGSGQNKMYVLRNTHTTGAISTTSLGAAQPFTVGGSADGFYGVKIADMDMDGKPDMVGVLKAATSIIGIYRNIATPGTLNAGSFESLVTYNSDAFPYEMTIGDIDGDAKPEIAVCSLGAASTGIFKNLSVPGTINTGSFSKTFAVDAVNGLGNMRTVALADMDGDGRTEILGSAGSGFGVLYQLPLLTPTAQASNLVFTQTTTLSGTLAWTNGNGASRMVFVKREATTGEPAPVDLDIYAISNSVLYGGQIGSSGWRAIYRGTGNSTVVYDLEPGGIYRLMVVELNNNGYTTGKYLSTPATGNPLTVSSPAEITYIGTVNPATNNLPIVDFAVGFSGSITGLTAANFALSTTGSISGASVLSVTGSGTTFGVSVATGTGDGTIRLNLVNGTGLSVPLTTPLPYEGWYYTIDKTGPALTPLSIASSNTLSATYAREGHSVSVRFTRPGETISAITAAIGGISVPTSNVVFDVVGTLTVTAAVPEGPLTFTVTADDYLGNKTTVTQTTNGSVVIVDKTAPVLPVVTIQSGNAIPTLAKAGDVITLNYHSNEPLGGSTVLIGGQPATVTNTGGNTWKATTTVTGTFANGIVPIMVQGKDWAGNESANLSATTNGSSVWIDNTAPLLTAISIVSDNVMPDKAKPGNKVTLRFTSSESITPLSVTLAGQTLAVTNTGGNNWEGSRILNTELNGVISFSIRVNDLAGNVSAAATATSDNSSVIFDKTIPVLSNVTIASGNIAPEKAKVGDVVKINFTASEPVTIVTLTIATHNVIPINTTGNAWTASYTLTAGDAEGIVPFSIAFADIAGNAGAITTATTNSSTVTFTRNISIPASLTRINFASDNAIPQKAKTGDRVTLNFVSAESLTSVTVTIATHAITPVNTTGNTWSAVYTLTAADAEGKIPFTIAAANLALPATGSTDNSHVWFDKTLPVVTGINRQSPATADVMAGPLVYRVQFSEPVSAVGKRNFRINATATAGTVIDTIITANDSTYDVRLIRITGTGTLRLDLDTTGNIADSAGNRMATRFSTGQQYHVAVPLNSVPVFVAGATATAAVCQNAAVLDLSDLLRITDADMGQTLTWTISSNAANGVLSNFPATAFSNGSTVTLPVAGYTPAAGFSGVDQFVIKVSDGTDSAMVTVKITVHSLPSENITATHGTVLCGPNASLPLTIANGSSISWMRNGSAIAEGGNQLSVRSADSYAAIVTDANGCAAMTQNSVLITTAQQPKAVFAYTDYCVNIPVSIINQSTGTPSLNYLWSDGNGHTSTAEQPSFTYSQPGNYTVTLKVSSSICPLLPDSLSQVIAVERPAAAVRMATIKAQAGQQVQLQARTFGRSYQWTPATDLTNSAVANPLLRVRAEQQYTVSIRSAAGCNTVDTMLVKVFENTVYVPRVFTPNGDGNNDVLYFNYINVRKLDYVRIYNRQGKLVWESSNMAEGWDGKFNGALQPLETYTWLIRATDIFGMPVNRQGNVTLLR